MTNIKRRIASFVAAFAMVGAVTIPSVAKYVTNDTAIVADAGTLHQEKVNFWVNIWGNTNFRQSPTTSSRVVASIKNTTKGKPCHLTYVAATTNGTWYYSQYDHGWVRYDRIKWN